MIKTPYLWFKATRRRNKAIVVVVFLVLFFVIRSRRQVSLESQYVTQKVSRESITALVSETGNVSVTGQVKVYSPTTGILEKLYVQNGDKVVAGQALMSVKSTASEQDRATAYATYQSANVALQVAQNNLRDKAAIAQRVLDDVRGHDSDETYLQKQTRTTAEVARDNAYDTVRSARAQLLSAQLTLATTQDVVIHAPVSGVVANLVASQGGNISYSTTVPALVVTNSSEYFVTLALNEVDIFKVKEGQKANISLDAFSGKKFNGVVTRLDSVGTITSGVVTYNVSVVISDPTSEIRSGMTANVDIEVDKISNTLTVPNSAVKPYQGKKAVQIIDTKANQLKFIPIEVGVKSPEKTEIKSGIDEGQEVVTGARNGSVGATKSGLFGN